MFQGPVPERRQKGQPGGREDEHRQAATKRVGSGGSTCRPAGLSRGGSLYTGITNDLPKRLKAHADGKASRYTRSRLPVALAYSESQRSKSAALKREAAIKRLRRAEKDRLLAGRKTPAERG